MLGSGAFALNAGVTTTCLGLRVIFTWVGSNTRMNPNSIRRRSRLRPAGGCFEAEARERNLTTLNGGLVVLFLALGCASILCSQEVAIVYFL